MDQKDFVGWIKLKAKIHYSGVLRSIKDGEIWWCAVGENVGSEINGKSKTFARPVLIVKKLSRYNFIGVPLTTKRHKGNWYVYFGFKDTEQIAVVAQVRNISSFRLYKRMGVVPESDLELVRKRLCALILEKKYPLTLRLGWAGIPEYELIIARGRLECNGFGRCGRSKHFDAPKTNIAITRGAKSHIKQIEFYSA